MMNKISKFLNQELLCQAIWQPKAKGKVSDVNGGGAPQPPPPRHEGK